MLDLLGRFGGSAQQAAFRALNTIAWDHGGDGLGKSHEQSEPLGLERLNPEPSRQAVAMRTSPAPDNVAAMQCSAAWSPAKKRRSGCKGIIDIRLFLALKLNRRSTAQPGSDGRLFQVLSDQSPLDAALLPVPLQVPTLLQDDTKVAGALRM